MRFIYKLTGSLLTMLLMNLFIMPGQSQAGLVRTPKSVLDRWSLQAAFDCEIDNDDYQGIQISLMHSLSPTSALRISLGFFENSEDSDNGRIYMGDDYGFVFRDGGDYDADGASLSIQYMYYPYTQSNLKFYVGAGPSLRIREANPYVDLLYYYDYPYYWADYIDFQDGKKLGLGFEGSLGMEYFLNENVSILAEYDFLIEHSWYLFDVHYYDGYGYYVSDWEAFDDDSWDDLSRFRIGLSLYF